MQREFKLLVKSNLISSIQESPPKFKNRIMAKVYVRSIARSTMYQKAPFVSQDWRMEN